MPAFVHADCRQLVTDFLFAGRSVLFAIVWAVTLGKHHFWLFPNLLADVGVLDSFKPLYTHEVKGDGKKDEGKLACFNAACFRKTTKILKIISVIIETI